MANVTITATYTFHEIGGRTMEQRSESDQDQAVRLFRGTCNGPRDSNLPTWELLLTKGVNLGTPLPKRGDPHPSHDGLTADEFSISEDANSGAIDVTITYSVYTFSSSPGSDDEPAYRETARSWSTTEEAIDLKNDAVTGVPVILPTGHPFESVPKTVVSCPVFSVTRKYKSLPTAILAANATLNSAAGTIDGVSIPARCGRLTASSNRIYNDPDGYLWECTITVTIKNNWVVLDGGTTSTNIGHDVALLFAGFYHLENGKPIRATEPDEETKELRPTTAPVLLTLTGGLLTDKTKAVFKRYATLPGAKWSASWFTQKETEKK